MAGLFGKKGFAAVVIGLGLLAAVGVGLAKFGRGEVAPAGDARGRRRASQEVEYAPRRYVDASGYSMVQPVLERWEADAPLEKIAEAWEGVAARYISMLDQELARVAGNPSEATALNIIKAAMCNYEGDPKKAAEVLAGARREVEESEAVASHMLYTLIYFQGVTEMRRGENENCIMCRGESSCILPINKAAVHTNPSGSRRAIGFFTEYLERFPDDLEVRWLLNLAHMTLGEHPGKVDPRFLISLERLEKSEFDIGRFRDVGHLLGVNRFGQAGGGMMEDFDGDGRLDIVVTSFDPGVPMAFYHNKGDGTFEDRTGSVGLSDQLGGLACFQADYNNDGRPDIFVPRGAWVDLPMRPSLLRNDGGTFTDVTAEAGLLNPRNSNSAAWADYDNDGHLDLFVCCERQPNCLYRNKGDGTFEEVAGRAGVDGSNSSFCKGVTWIDYDNDGDQDLFTNNLAGYAKLYRNEGKGTFREVTASMHIDGPRQGFSCWTWDFDNDGWLDIFATSYDRTTAGIVQGLMGEPSTNQKGRLYRNLGGESFEDVTAAAGVDGVYAAMGSNFGDLDNDGLLDFYLGTGEPDIATLVPNRMFKNVDGRRFAEITGSSGTGHLQKGHGVAMGDWDRDGDLDVFAEMGGVIAGDLYHDIMFQNPGQGNHWLTVKLVGEKTNRSAIGARIKAVTAGKEPRTVHLMVSSGSSFGANPLEQHLGLGKATGVSTLEIHWPTSGTTQVFKDVPGDRSIEIKEFGDSYVTLETPALPQPK